MAYRIYITDSLKAAYNLNMRYVDFINDSIPDSDESGEEIINRIKDKMTRL